MTEEELAERLGYKSLKRARYEEIPLPDSKRRHIADIIRLHQLLEEGPQDLESRQPRERLKAALEGAGMSPAQLAKKMKYDAGVIESVVNGTSRITEKMAEAVVKVLPALSVDDLLAGSEFAPVRDPSGHRGTYGAKPPVELPGKGRTRYVPLLSWAAAGTLSNAEALDEGYNYEGIASNVPGRVFAVEVKGDSMHPEINPGDYAVVKADAEPSPGGVVLVRTINGDVLCKRYATREGGQLTILSSVNHSYQPIEIPTEEIAWIYPVKQVIRNY